jgi:glycosyltransferase involved in cell wall biosynthesis
MQVLPYFLPGTFSETPPPRTSTRPHDRPYFLTVGRLTRIKGLDSVIPVFQRFPDADLLIIGDGEEMTALRTLAADAPNIKVLGRIPNDQLSRYYEHAVAALMPSLGYETFGIVLIEAFRYQTPVIARRIGPFPEIVDRANGGLLFSDGPELLAAMTRLLGDVAFRDSLAASAYRACRQYWSEEVVIGDYLKLIADARAARPVHR